MDRKDRELLKISYRLQQCSREQGQAKEQSREDRLWKEIVADIEKKKRKRWLVRCGAIAAAVVLVFIGSNLYYLQNASGLSDIEQVAAAYEDLAGTYRRGGNSVVLQGKGHINVNEHSSVAYSDDGDLEVNERHYATKSGKGQAEFNHLVVPYGKNTRLVLSDGSKIWVNAGTHLVYPVTFGEKERRIFVDGEVYLEVARDEKHPFVVATTGFEVNVLGTVFNVCNYKESGKASVVLVSGVVEVSSREKETVKLKPDERVEINLGQIGEKQKVTVGDYVSWTSNILTCRSESLGRILEYLGHYYGVRLIYNKDAIAAACIAGKLDLKPTIGEVLTALAGMLPISWKEKDEIIYIENNELKQ